MSLRARITDELKTAMKAKDADRLAALRLINAAIKDMEIAGRGGSAPGDPEVMAVLTRMVKQRRESARAYEEAVRLDLAEKERAEIDVIESFLPRQMSQDETRAAVDRVIAETGASSVRDIGKVMSALKARHGGQMDFGAAGAMVKAALA